MDIQKEMTEEAVNAAWNMFQRMPSSNPDDYAYAVVRALMPLVKRARAEALREAQSLIAADGFFCPSLDARIEQGETDD